MAGARDTGNGGASETVAGGGAAPVPRMVLAPDPTQNVKDIVEAATSRFDSLRDADVEMAKALRDADRRTTDAEMRRIDDLMTQNRVYTEKLEIAEAKRIDAIRAVDVNAVAIANQRATDQAAVLASQVQASAETLRLLVASTASTQKQQLDQTTSQLSDRISVVERFQYEGRGSAGNISPVIAEQLNQLQAQLVMLKESRDRNEGKSGISGPLLATVVGIIAAALGAAIVGFLGG